MTILKISNTRWHTCLTNLSHSIFQHYVKIVQIRSIFWSVFSCIRTEYRKIRTRKYSLFGHFSRSAENMFIHFNEHSEIHSDCRSLL